MNLEDELEQAWLDGDISHAEACAILEYSDRRH